MKNSKINSYGLLGLMAALALNMSGLWPTEGNNSQASLREYRSSHSGSSYREAIKKCIERYSNRGNLTNFTAKCKTRSEGKNVDVTIEMKDTMSTFKKAEGKKEGDGKFNVKKAKAETADEDSDKNKTKAEDQIPDVVAEITVATSCNCGDGRELTRSESYSVNNNDFNDTSTLTNRVFDIVDITLDDAAEIKKENRLAERIKRNWESCSKNEYGEKFEDTEELQDCFERNLDELDGSKLVNLINDKIFPETISAMFRNPELANEYMELLQSYEEKGIVRDTLTNIYSMQKDRAGYEKGLASLARVTKSLPPGPMTEQFYKEERNKMEQEFGNYVSETMTKETGLKPFLGPQYDIIESVLVSGQPPRSNSLYSSLYDDDNDYDTNIRGSSFNADMASRAIRAMNPSTSVSDSNSYVRTAGSSINSTYRSKRG